jgi:hypothetical protein
MKRVMPFLCLAGVLASACTGGTQGFPAAPASKPSANEANITDRFDRTAMDGL